MNYSILSYLSLCIVTIGSTLYAAPRITSIKWGVIQVEENKKIYTYKDCMLWPTKHQNWDWSKTGTKHDPGIQIADLKEFIDSVDVVVLSQGMDLVLKVQPSIVEHIKKLKKEVHVAQSEKAVEIYNRLVDEGKRVGALIHSTC